VTQVELPAVVEQRPVQIQLYDIGLASAVSVLLLPAQDLVELVDLVDDGDTVAAVTQLAGLDDPDIPKGFARGLALLDRLLLFLDVCRTLFMVVQEALVLRTFEPVADVEREREVVEDVMLC